MKKKQLFKYFPYVILVLFIFTNADKPGFDNNKCEKESLEIISMSENNIIKLENDCKVLTWKPNYNPNNSKLNARLIKEWNITKREKLYFNQ